MGKSPGSNYETPESWTPPANMINQPGQVSRAPQQGQTPSFLPNDPSAMATGLTPEMVALIMGTQSPALSGQPQPQDGRAALAAMLTPQGGQNLG